ncbi:MAG: DUF4293 domain-containing protein [Bacteroidales bacterium]|nr:MAG: DUF4293 domain-containing protein [Bacteroidales bacterium]
MIQRIQSLYLLIVSILMMFMLFLPIAEIAVERKQVISEKETADIKEIVIYKNYGAVIYSDNKAKTIFSTWPVTTMICITGLISFFTIFLYTSRMLQIRLCVFNALLFLGLSALTYYYFTAIRKQVNVSDLSIVGHTFKISIIFPVIAFILTFLAFRAVRRDELLVRSYERLRK